VMKTLVVFFLTVIFFQARSQSTNELQSIVDLEAGKFMSNDGSVGLAIGIYKNGRTYTFGYGRADKGKEDKPNAGSIFNIASLSKTFTGLLLAQAVSEKKMGLEDDIRKYLHGDYQNLQYNGQPIRLSHLVSHVSRLPFFLSERAEDPGYSKVDFFTDLHKVKLDTIPGIRFLYSNAGFQLLGYILEDVYKTSFEHLMEEKVTRPLQMKQTGVTLADANKKSKTMGYNKDGTFNPELYDYLQGAGGLKSSVDDLLKYVEYQIKESNDAVRLTHQEIWGFDMGGGKHYSFSMGWQIVKMLPSVSDGDGLRRVSQDGNLPSYSSVVIFCPELETGIVVLSNSFMMEPAGNLANAILQGIEPAMP
jgi:serine-type D-Ala-D-Ala carboxypeptidase/endopeptidase